MLAERLRRSVAVEYVNKRRYGQPVGNIDDHYAKCRGQPERRDRLHVRREKRAESHHGRQAGHECRPGQDRERFAVRRDVIPSRLAPPAVLLLVVQGLRDADDQDQSQDLAVDDGEGLPEHRHDTEDQRYRQGDAGKARHDVSEPAEIDEQDHQHHREQNRDAAQYADQHFVGVDLFDLGIAGDAGRDTGLPRPVVHCGAELLHRGTPVGEIAVGDVERDGDRDLSVVVAEDDPPG